MLVWVIKSLDIGLTSLIQHARISSFRIEIACPFFPAYLKIVRILGLFIIKTRPTDKYAFSAYVFHEIESILEHNPCYVSAYRLTACGERDMFQTFQIVTEVTERKKSSMVRTVVWYVDPQNQ